MTDFVEPTATESPAEAKVLRPVTLTTISQALSAASNFVIVWALGRHGGDTEVGRYILAFAVYSAALGLQRSMVTDTLMARPIGGTAEPAEEIGRTVVCSLSISGAIALVLAAVGSITSYRQLLLMAPFLPLLLLQDSCRFLLFRSGRHARAAWLDGLWFVVSCSGFVVLADHPDHLSALLVWVTGGGVAAILGLLVVNPSAMSPLESWRWWRTDLWPSSRWLALETGFFHADQQLANFGFEAIAGAALFGAYQIAGSLIGVSVFVTTGFGVVAIGRFTRGRGDQRREAALVSALSFGCVAVVTGTMLVAGDWVIDLLFGNKVHISHDVILGTGAIYAFISSSNGFHALLRSRRSERVLPIARGIGLLLFTPTALLVSSHSFVAALWVLAAEAACYLAIITWHAMRHAHCEVPDAR